MNGMTIDLQAAANKVSQSLLPATSTAKSASATAATGTATTASTASTSGDITSNDFLTLLVTEMKNQDPTQPTDPNAYIQQLVGVNSLQQLIAINGDLGGNGSSNGSGSSQGTTGVTSVTGS